MENLIDLIKEALDAREHELRFSNSLQRMGSYGHDDAIEESKKAAKKLEDKLRTMIEESVKLQLTALRNSL